LLAAHWPPIFAQSTAPLPSCEPRQEVRQVLDEKLSEKTLQEMKFNDRLAFRKHVLEDLIAKYPSEVEPYRRLIETTKDQDTEHFPALVESYRKAAEQNPDDPLALYVAGLALNGIDTNRSIQLLERARSVAPQFPWRALELANIYTRGVKRADPKKSGEEIAAFFRACPASTDPKAQHRLDRAGSSELQARVAAAVRARLATETNPLRLKDYETLWGLEFRTHPPQEHEALRKQVMADLQRMETLNPKPDAGWLVFLKDGYKRAGASPETITAMEERVIRTFPHSEEAYEIVTARWEKDHPEPQDAGDAAAWAAYNTEYRKALKGWIAQFTESRELQHEERFEAIRFDPDVPAEEGLRALDDYLTYVGAYEQPTIGPYLAAAGFLVDHNWQPKRVFDLLRNADKWIDEWHARRMGDNLSDEDTDAWANNETIMRQSAALDILAAARLSEQPMEAERLKAYLERPLPANTWPNIESQYWLNRGQLAALEGSKVDALTYYQKALQSRKVPPRAFLGRTRDRLLDEARALWKQLGGTETAWAVWSKPPASKIEERVEAGWKKPTKAMPAFELADLAGKTWRLKNLEGRAVLINVWATWCGPCKAELPKLQKLYDTVKDRADVQILTLTIDEDLGAVAPFMKEHGYSFPVLPAYGFVNELLESVGIPQNWIVDTKGVWRWTGMPAVPDAEWGNAMLAKLESVK
jgi:thiol-disulfide isomerase/thioredoxin